MIPISFNIDMFSLSKTSGNPLPFDIWAYYDLSFQWGRPMERETQPRC